MNANHFKALLKTMFVSFVFGVLYILFLLILFSDIMHEQIAMHLLIGIVLTIISCGVINVVVLPIITLTDKKAMDEKSFKELMHRYLPIFATPFMILFGIFVLAEGAELEIIMHVFLVMLVSYTNLYVYIKPPDPQGGNDDATENTSIR
jgi:hypothetical protein